MNNKLRLLSVCNYPSDNNPAHQVFVRAILLELASLGVEVNVLAPETLWNLARQKTNFQLAPSFEIRDYIPIYRPRYLTSSTINLPFLGSTRKWSDDSHLKAVLSTAKKLNSSFDLCFAHFLYPHGHSAAKVSAMLGIPAVVSLGESSFKRYENAYQLPEISQLLNRFSGIIANSSLIKAHCVQRYGIREEKINVFPNGVDEHKFYLHDRKLARQHCQLPLERPIIIFVGQFIERKGPLRVLEAIKSRPDIAAVFLGHGPQIPQSSQVLYQGTVPHEDVPIWLSAADVFVLPTLDEGCSNAILEALSCGLPVVSSNLPFNHGILNQQVAILVDPTNIDSLGKAIFSLVDNPSNLTLMAEAARQHSESFRIKDRAQKILELLLGIASKNITKELV